ncbi:MAG: DNA alkylation repair protein [Bacteroidales bacterium]|nr:DNA alkylation repair protein [Tenuifilaceae bacterium]
MTLQIIIEEIKNRRNGAISHNLSYLGLNYKVNYGVIITELKEIADSYKYDHQLALLLYQQEIRECKILASMIDDPKEVTINQMDTWSQDFTNAEIVEQTCTNLFWKSEYGLSKSIEWCLSHNDFLIKAGLILVGRIAASEEIIKEVVFAPYIDIIDDYDETTIASNMNNIEFALRQIALRNTTHRQKVIAIAEKMSTSNSEHRAWIGDQLLFELDSE